MKTLSTHGAKYKDFGFKLRGIYWEIKFVDRVDKKGNWGETDYERAVVRIRKGLSGAILRYTVFHEVFHIIFECFEDDFIEEEVACNLLAEAMIEIWSKLPKWLRG